MQGTLRTKFASLVRIDLLVLDDSLLAPLEPTERRNLLELMDNRYDKRSVIVCNQLPDEKMARHYRRSDARRRDPSPNTFLDNGDSSIWHPGFRSWSGCDGLAVHLLFDGPRVGSFSAVAVVDSAEFHEDLVFPIGECLSGKNMPLMASFV